MAQKKKKRSIRQKSRASIEEQDYERLDLQADEFVSKIGARIRAIRNKKQMSLIAVEAVGYPSWKHLQKIESSTKQPTLKTIYKISRALGISPADILKGLE